MRMRGICVSNNELKSITNHNINSKPINTISRSNFHSFSQPAPKFFTSRPIQQTSSLLFNKTSHFIPFTRLYTTSESSTSIPNDNINIKKIKIYTKTGDAGTSSLFNGERRPKTDIIFDALGHTDELNSFIGIARESILQNKKFEENKEIKLTDWLAEIQSRLLDAGSAIATPISQSSEKHLLRVEFPQESVDLLENWIDQMDGYLPPLKQFILPGGGPEAAFLHSARSIARRAERSVVHLQSDVPPSLLKFLNRLSDFFFMAARYSSFVNGISDVQYKKQQTKNTEK